LHNHSEVGRKKRSSIKSRQPCVPQSLPSVSFFFFPLPAQEKKTQHFHSNATAFRIEIFYTCTEKSKKKKIHIFLLRFPERAQQRERVNVRLLDFDKWQWMNAFSSAAQTFATTPSRQTHFH
jgi:hypothetical protein